MYSKKDWAKVGVLALLMVMCIVSFAFELIHVEVEALDITEGAGGFSIMFNGFKEEIVQQIAGGQRGTITAITLVALLLGFIGLGVVVYNAYKKNEITTDIVVKVFLIALAICFLQLVGYLALNGTITEELLEYCTVTTGWFIMPIIAAVLLLAYFAVNKYMED